MNIIVCIKQVPDTTDVKIHPETGSLMRESVHSIVNPDDTHAIEEAVRLREKFGGDTGCRGRRLQSRSGKGLD